MTTPPANAAAPQFIVAVKKGIIQALRATFTSSYPDPILRDMSVNMEYPVEIEHYPGIWVQFSFRDVQASGIGNPVFLNEDEQQYQLWMYGGTITLTIVALTSKERDTIADKVIQMYAFHSLNTYADTFHNFIKNWQYIFMTPNSDVLRPMGQSTTVGAPWQEDLLVYEDAYSFDVIGQFASDFPSGDLLYLREILPKPYLQGSTSTQVDDGNGTWV